MDTSSITDRIRALINIKGLNDNMFASTIGVPYTTLNGLLQRGGDVKSSILQSILEVYPDISPSWLLMGQGEMFSTTQEGNEYQASAEPLPIVPPETIRVTNLDTMDWMKRNDVRSLSINQLVSAPEALIGMASDAMSPVIEKGDTLAFRKLPDYGDIVDGECYIVDTLSRGIVIRNIYCNGEDLIGKSINRHYAPIKIHRDDIVAINQIVGLIRTHLSTADNTGMEQMNRMMDSFGEVIRQNSKMIDYITRIDR